MVSQVGKLPNNTIWRPLTVSPGRWPWQVALLLPPGPSTGRRSLAGSLPLHTAGGPLTGSLTLHTDKGTRTVQKEKMIFPRYHQLDVVRKLVAHAKAHGAGRNYLIQHSAGSGKSNSIAWLAHRLASLHNGHNEKVFHSVVVVTDRRVLDQQLQQTIYQFEHKTGVVEKDEDGYFWIMGRVDDVINVSGHRLGTMEIKGLM